jgi:hypothetical protein
VGGRAEFGAHTHSIITDTLSGSVSAQTTMTAPERPLVLMHITVIYATGNPFSMTAVEVSDLRQITIEHNVEVLASPRATSTRSGKLSDQFWYLFGVYNRSTPVRLKRIMSI